MIKVHVHVLTKFPTSLLEISAQHLVIENVQIHIATYMVMPISSKFMKFV